MITLLKPTTDQIEACETRTASIRTVERETCHLGAVRSIKFRLTAIRCGLPRTIAGRAAAAIFYEYGKLHARAEPYG